MPETDPTPWELMRTLRDIKDQQERIAASMLTAQMFEIHQRGTDRRFAEIEKDLKDESEARVSGDKLLEGKLTDRERFKRSVWASVGLAILAALLSFAVTLASAGGAPAP